MEYKNEIQQNEDMIDLSVLIGDLIKGIKRLWWMMTLIILLSAGITCYMEYREYSPYYTASATFTVSLGNSTDQSSIYEESTKATLMSKTFPYIIMNGILNDIVQEDLGYDYIAEDISAEDIEDTNLFTISVKSDDPQRAYAILQSVINNYPKVAEPVVGSTHLTMLDQTGVPQSPDNRKEYWNSLKKGAIPGVVVSLFALFLFAFTKRTIHGQDDLIKLTSMRNLGVLPVVTFKKRGKQYNKTVTLLNDKVSPWYRESIYKIRTRVEKAMNKRSMKSIVITSAVSGEGKTTFALNLAIAMVELNKKVLLLDCDLYKPSVAKMLLLNEDVAGLEQVLKEEISLENAIQYCETTSLHVLAGHVPVKNATELVGSAEMGIIMEQLEEMYDVIIIDSAPSAILSDTSVLSRQVDGMIYVVKQDYAKVNLILESLDNINESSNIEIIGSVINCSKSGIGGYGYGYNYGYERYGSERKSNHKDNIQFQYSEE